MRRYSFDIINTMIFYGKKYIIHAPAPNPDTEYDYAMEILSPIDEIGIRLSKNKIVMLSRESSQNNIIYGSKIIQINDIYVTGKMDQNTINQLVDHAKTVTPSYIVFRSQKSDHQKGTHLQFDVSFDIDADEDKDKDDIDFKFPYYKFKKDAVQSIFDDRIFVI